MRESRPAEEKRRRGKRGEGAAVRDRQRLGRKEGETHVFGVGFPVIDVDLGDAADEQLLECGREEE
jgi:hypothetical protein